MRLKSIKLLVLLRKKSRIVHVRRFVQHEGRGDNNTEGKVWSAQILNFRHRARHTTSPPSPSRKASRASSHSCSLSSVCTTATSPIPRGFTCCALRPEHILRISSGDINIRLLGLLMSSMPFSTGRSSRYFRSAHIRR